MRDLCQWELGEVAILQMIADDFLSKLEVR